MTTSTVSSDDRELSDRILELFLDDEVTQPLVIDEIYRALGVLEHEARRAANALIDEDQLFKRVETADERRVRFGGVLAGGTYANLYSINGEVPTRTARVAHSAYTASYERTPFEDQNKRGERLDLVKRALRETEEAHLSAYQLAELTGLTPDNARNAADVLSRAKKARKISAYPSNDTTRIYTCYAPVRRNPSRRSSDSPTTQELEAAPLIAASSVSASVVSDPVTDAMAVLTAHFASKTESLERALETVTSERDAAVAALAGLRETLRAITAP